MKTIGMGWVQGAVVSRRLAAVVFLFLALTLAQALYCLARSSYRQEGYPHNTPLFDPAQRLNDFFTEYPHGVLTLRGGNPYTDPDLFEHRVPAVLSDLPAKARRISVPQAYFPFAGIVLAGFASFSLAAAVRLFLCLVILGSIGLLVYQAAKEEQLGDGRLFLSFAVPLLLFSHPFLFMLDRGNLEGVVLLCTWAYLLLSKHRPDRAWPLLGIAMMIKPQAAALGLLPLLRRDHASLLKSALFAFFLGTLSLAALPGSFSDSVIGLQRGMDWALRDHMILHDRIRFNHTFFNLLKGLNLQFSAGLPAAAIAAASSLLSGGLGVWAVARLWSRRAHLPFEHMALGAVFIMITLPPVSFDYTLVQLLPIYFMLIAGMMGSRVPDARCLPLLLVLTLVLAPKEMFIESAWLPYGPGYIVNPLLLLTAFLIATGRDAVAEASATARVPGGRGVGLLEDREGCVATATAGSLT